jgi:hypothetical protein
VPACEERPPDRTRISSVLSPSLPTIISCVVFYRVVGALRPALRLLVAQAKKVPAWLKDFPGKEIRCLARSLRASSLNRPHWGRQDDFAALSDADKVVWKEIALALRGSSD